VCEVFNFSYKLSWLITIKIFQSNEAYLAPSWCDLYHEFTNIIYNIHNIQISVTRDQ